MPPPSPKRRPVSLAALEEHAATVKLRTGIVLPETKKQTVSLPRESFVPLIQAEVGADVPLFVHRYRLLRLLRVRANDAVAAQAFVG